MMKKEIEETLEEELRKKIAQKERFEDLKKNLAFIELLNIIKDRIEKEKESLLTSNVDRFEFLKGHIIGLKEIFSVMEYIIREGEIAEEHLEEIKEEKNA